MKVAVTGASGFIGRALAKALGERAIAQPRDQPLVPGCEALVHLAGIAHRAASAAELTEANVRLTARLGREAAGLGIPFLFVSSVKVHGEESIEPLTERSPIVPRDPYGESKARAEEALHAMATLKLTVLRPPLVYGPGVKANFLALVRAVARGWPLPFASIDNRRSFIYVGNLVDAVLHALGTPGTFLVADGPAISTPELCRRIGIALSTRARLFSFPPAMLPGKLARSLEIDDAAFRSTFSWRPPQTAEAGLKATAQWYRSV
jgi:nucleoside-diphosphate-sugar epimerase